MNLHTAMALNSKSSHLGPVDTATQLIAKTLVLGHGVRDLSTEKSYSSSCSHLFSRHITPYLPGFTKIT